MVFADLFFIYVFLPLCLICYGLAAQHQKHRADCLFTHLLRLGRAALDFAFCCSVHSLTGSSAY